MRKIRDKWLLGVVAGALGWLPKELINWTAHYSGVQKKRYGQVIAGVFLSPKRTKTRSGVWFGVAADLAVASLLGIPVAYSLSSTGKDYAPLKGAVIALLGFGGFRGVVANIGLSKVYPRDAVSNSLMTASSMTWGAATGAIMRAIADESVFPTRKPGSSLLANEGQGHESQHGSAAVEDFWRSTVVD